MEILRVGTFSIIGAFLLSACTSTPKVYHSVTFNTQGGSEIKFVEVEDSHKLAPPDNPTKRGYDFLDWYTDNTFTLRYDFDLPVRNDFTLYAKWSDPINYSIIYHLNGGTVASNPRSYTIEDKISIKDATPPTTYKNFGAWCLDEELTTPIMDKGWNPGDHTGEINLYAKYINPTPYKINYMLNGGTNNIQNPSIYTIEDEVVLKDPTFTNNVFVGWYTTSTFEDGTEIAKIEKGCFGEISLYACWHDKSKTLDNTSWDEINRISKYGVAESCFGSITSKAPIEKTVVVNGQSHKVRIIGYGQDVDENGQEIGITFEFANLISDNQGYSLATYWKNTNTTDGSNSDYRDSSIRKALTGEGEGDLNWFEKDSYSFSTIFANTSVLDMLPDDLNKEGILKTVKKMVNVKTDGVWTPTEFTDKLFLLNPIELGYSDQYSEDSTTYMFYEGHSDREGRIRIKAQVNGARITTYLWGTHLAGKYNQNIKFSYAGYNDPGAPLWLRSPYTDYSDNSRRVSNIGGVVDCQPVYNYAYGVAPAFCV